MDPTGLFAVPSTMIVWVNPAGATLCSYDIANQAAGAASCGITSGNGPAGSTGMPQQLPYTKYNWVNIAIAGAAVWFFVKHNKKS